MTYTDAILYMPDLQSLLSWFVQNRPQDLAQDMMGTIIQPPAITAFARTPTVINGNTAMAYLRVTPDQQAILSTIPANLVTILAQVPYSGAGTSDALYAVLAANANAQATYDAVYPRAPVTVTNPDGTTTSSTPPARFGEMG